MRAPWAAALGFAFRDPAAFSPEELAPLLPEVFAQAPELAASAAVRALPAVVAAQGSASGVELLKVGQVGGEGVARGSGM